MQRYFLTMCTLNRAEFFRDASGVSLALDEFFYTARERRMGIVAFCFMPDHLHLLAEGKSDDADLKQFARMSKQRAAFRFKRQHRRKLWQEAYYDRILRSEEKSEDVIYYIITNPVRSHLVENVTDYPFWGSSLYSREALLAYIGYRG